MEKQHPPQDSTRLLRRPEVERLTGKSRSAIYLDIRRGRFPHPVPIGLRAVAWRESDIKRWIEGCGQQGGTV